MIGDVKIPYKGKDVTIRLTLGALEEICEVQKVDIAPVVILGAIQSGIWNVKEVSQVLEAGLKATGQDISASDLVEEIGATAAAEKAADALKAFFEGASGNAKAAEDSTAT